MSPLQTARVLHAAIVAGPVLVALLAIWMRSGESPAALNPDERRLMLYIWMALLVGSVMGAMSLWRTRVAPRIEAAERGETTGDDDALLPALLPIWSIVEGAAIIGVVMYMVSGVTTLLVMALAAILLNGVVTRPRAAWFGER